MGLQPAADVDYGLAPEQRGLLYGDQIKRIFRMSVETVPVNVGD